VQICTKFLPLQKKENDMEKMTNFSKKHAIYFAISVVAFLVITAIVPEWCWVPIPFVCTFFVEMLGWIR
jgi:cell division protein FtsW (lipid II flippase)